MIEKDKVVIMTGSVRGIGREIAITLADAGANRVVADINLEGANKVVKEIINNKKEENLLYKLVLL